ncbi:MAG: pyridoxal phosphate-dependent aminotransferase [Candidatus Bathyarchaeia archaeon]
MSIEEWGLVSHWEPVERLKLIKSSGIRRFFALAQEMPVCFNLSVGEPDFCVPSHALDGGWRAVKEGRTHYAPTNGVPELRDALAQKAYRDYGLNYDPNCEILVTVGGTQAIFTALMGLLNPGDEVLIPDPGFVVYEPGVLLAGGVPVHVPLREDNDFRPSMSDVTSLITDKSRVMILNYPNNPTGSVLSYDEVAALAKITVDCDLVVISDEVYEKMVYDGVKHYCLATFPEMHERTLVINSFSKTYAMTGLRVGCVYGPRDLVSPLWLVNQYTVACVDTFSQYVALAALKGPQECVEEMVKEFDRRRHLVHKRLNEIKGFKCQLPKGAFYAFPNIRGSGISSEQLAEFLVKEASVLTVPGSAFGACGEGYLRLSYASAYKDLEEALDRMEMALRKLG